MKHAIRIGLALAALAIAAPAVHAQEIDEATRIRNRERMATLLAAAGPAINIEFRQSTQNPFNYVGHLKTGLANAEDLEVVVRVTNVDTYSLRIYPHYKGGYVNVDKARNPTALMRALLRLSDRTFLFWGVDDDGDVFAAYTFTLESGFPEEAIRIVLRSIVNHDKFFGELRQHID